jgi:hypothetical protein
MDIMCCFHNDLRRLSIFVKFKHEQMKASGVGCQVSGVRCQGVEVLNTETLTRIINLPNPDKAEK